MASNKKEKSMESILWSACDKLRGAVEPAEYKHVILSLIFLKYANDRFDIQREKLIKEVAIMNLYPIGFILEIDPSEKNIDDTTDITKFTTLKYDEL